MKLETFVNTNLKAFALDDIGRSIPCVIDGLKPSQRKIIYTVLNTTDKEIKVSQLAAKTSEMTHYKHGETSLQGTAVGLAQNHAGSNNCNLLEPIGQFGSILSGTASSPRYIYTKASTNLRSVFLKDDDLILETLLEEGYPIEPKHYNPILPIYLLNGAKGIGTGFAVNILNYNIKDIKKYILNYIQNKPNKNLIPHYVGHDCLINKQENQTTFTGKLDLINTTTIHISSLPVGYDEDSYKKILVKMLESNTIKDFSNNSTAERFSFEIKMLRSVTSGKSNEQLLKLFKLITTQTENVTLLDENKKIVVFDSVEESLNYFIDFRLKMYESRIKYQKELNRTEFSFLSDKITFITNWNKDNNIHKLSVDKIKDKMLSWGIAEESLDKLLSIKISGLSVTNTDKLEVSVEELDANYKWLSEITPIKYYTKDLK